MSGNGWTEICLDIGEYRLREFTSHGARNDQTHRVRVRGDGCMATVYEDGHAGGGRGGRAVRLAEGVHGHDKFFRMGVSSIRVWRSAGYDYCPFQAQLNLYAMGEKDGWPKFHTSRSWRRVMKKTQCPCHYKCKYDWFWKEHQGHVEVPAGENVDCGKPAFTRFGSRRCWAGFESVWHCKWVGRLGAH